MKKKIWLDEEKCFRPHFLNLLTQSEIYYDRIEPSKGMTVGIPDVFCLPDGEAVFVELKVGEMKDGVLFCREIRPAQFRWHDEYQKAGGKSFFVCGVIDGKQWRLCKFSLDTAISYMNGISEANMSIFDTIEKSWLKCT